MATRHQVQFTTIASGDSISPEIGLGNAHINAIWVPTVDSGELRLLGSFDQNSANFVRMEDTNIDPGGSGYSNEFLWQVGPGSKALLMHSAYDGTPFAKVEMSVAQTDNRTLALILAF